MRCFLPFIALASSLSGCSDDWVPAPLAAPGQVEALYGVAAETQLTPYPSNRYTVADTTTATGLRVHIGPDNTSDLLVSGYGTTIDQLNTMDGFSTCGGVAVGFSGPIDIRGIVTDEEADPPITDPVRDASDYKAADAPFVLVNVDPSSPERGEAVGLVPRWWAQPKDSYYLIDEFTIVAQPARPLAPGTRYVFAVTRGLKAASGGPVVRSRETEALLGGSPGDAYAEEVHAALDELEVSLGVRRDDVALATVFTTATVHADVVEMAKAARAAPPPGLASPWEVETPMADDARIRFKAAFETPEYRRPAPDGKWIIENGRPVAQATVPLEVFLAFSNGARSGPRPVVIFGHGLGGDKDGGWGTAERLSELDAAVFSIDSPEHGSRSSDPDNPLTATFGFFGVDAETQVFDIGRARDNFRQMASDQLELVRFIRTLGGLDLLPAGAPDGTPDLDVSRILYIGHSFGSVQGPTIFALAPEITQAVWNVGGDGLMALLRDSGTFGILVNGIKPPGTPDGALARFFAATQAIVDPGEPLNYARFGTEVALPGVTGWAPRDILLQEVINDSIVPNSSSEALARAAGLAQIDPIVPISGVSSAPAPVTGNLPSGATGAISQFDVVNGDELATHGELIFSPEARAQYVEFFRTGLAAPHATIISPY